jgi:hypothetical protein
MACLGKRKKNQPKKIGKKRTGKYTENDYLHFSMLDLSMPKIAKNAVTQKTYYKQIMMP